MSGERSMNLHGRATAVLPMNLPRCAAAAALSLLVVAALMVVARRFAGALTNPLEPATMLAAAALVRDRRGRDSLGLVPAVRGSRCAAV